MELTTPPPGNSMRAAGGGGGNRAGHSGGGGGAGGAGIAASASVDVCVLTFARAMAAADAATPMRTLRRDRVGIVPIPERALAGRPVIPLVTLVTRGT